MLVLEVGDEGIVGILILFTNGLGDRETLLLEGDALEAVRKFGLAVLDEGNPGEGADGYITLRCILGLLGLGGLADFTALSLLAKGSGDTLVENELIGEGQVRDLGDDGVNDGIVGRHFSLKS